jgi:hypothetical protein
MTTTPRQPVRPAARKPAEETSDIGAIAREAAREPARTLKPGEVLGRNGEVLSLKRDPHQDMFYIPPHLMDPDWTYEWKREMVLDKPDVPHMVHLKENGWREVLVQPGSKWEGMFMEAGYTGPIRREGNVLMERPKALTDQVRAMEARKANGQLADIKDKYTHRRAAVDTPRGYAPREGKIDIGYDIGPSAGKLMPIE